MLARRNVCSCRSRRRSSSSSPPSLLAGSVPSPAATRAVPPAPPPPRKKLVPPRLRRVGATEPFSAPLTLLRLGSTSEPCLCCSCGWKGRNRAPTACSTAARCDVLWNDDFHQRSRATCCDPLLEFEDDGFATIPADDGFTGAVGGVSRGCGTRNERGSHGWEQWTTYRVPPRPRPHQPRPWPWQWPC